MSLILVFESGSFVLRLDNAARANLVATRYGNQRRPLETPRKPTATKSVTKLMRTTAWQAGPRLETGVVEGRVGHGVDP